MKIERLLLISGGKTAVVFKFEEQLLHQMTLLACMPVGMSGMFCIDAAGNDHDSASFFHPTDKLVAVITLIGQNRFVPQVKRFQRSLCYADVIAVPTGKQKTQWVPQPIRHRMDFRCQTTPAPPGFFVVSPFLAPLACR